MNRYIAFVLSIAILFQSFGFSTDVISKISEVVEHAKFHNTEYGDNLVVFLSKHYGDLMADHQKEHQEEQEQHEELPFKQLSTLAGSLSMALIFYSIDVPCPVNVYLNSQNFIYKVGCGSFFLDKQLRPPRVSYC